MDLCSVVAVSMLPLSRSKVAAAFKDLRHQNVPDPLEAVLGACHCAPEAWTELGTQARRRASEAVIASREKGIEPIPLGDPRYPVLLGCIPDPPPVLWVQGVAEVLNRPAVAIVGSRAATPYAREIACRLAEELAGRDVVVVSGLARGADSAAHRGCLQADGSTAAILGSGLDRIYPPEHAELSRQIVRKGVIASEFCPGTPPQPEHFPLRNRIISGISLAVVVVEASEKSGSLITARLALEQGREVMAVPGSVLSGRNRGSHGLLKDGAKVVETADDILDELGWPASGQPSAHLIERKGPGSDPLLSKMEPGEQYRLEDLQALTGVPAPKLLPRLMELELRGAVGGVGGGRFARLTGTK